MSDARLGIILSRLVERSLLGKISVQSTMTTIDADTFQNKYSNSASLLPPSLFSSNGSSHSSHPIRLPYHKIHLSIVREQLVVEREDGGTGIWV